MSKISKQYNDIKELVEGMEDDIKKVSEKGVRKAGQRARKTLQEVKKLGQQLRLDIMEEIRKG